MLNEHVCATILYYYDFENITDSHLAFREGVDVYKMQANAPSIRYSLLIQAGSLKPVKVR